MKITMEDLNGIIKEVLEEISLEKKFNLFVNRRMYQLYPSKKGKKTKDKQKRNLMFIHQHMQMMYEDLGLQKSIKQQVGAKNWGIIMKE